MNVVLKHCDQDRVVSKLLPGLGEMILYGGDENLIWEVGVTTFPLILKDYPESFSAVMESYRFMLVHEESAIREGSLKGLSTILENNVTATLDQFVSLYESVVLGGKANNCHFARCSSNKMFALMFQHLSLNQRQSMLPTYLSHASDESPLVRKAFASSLAQVADHAITQELFESIYPAAITGWKDEYLEQVRVDSLCTLMTMARKLSPPKIEKHIISTLSRITTDASWRIRLTFLDQAHKFMAVTGPELNKKYVWPWIIELLSDGVVEVSTRAFQIIHHCMKYLDAEVYQSCVAESVAEFLKDPESKEEDAVAAVALIVGDSAGSMKSSELARCSEVLMGHSSSVVRTNLVSQFPFILGLLDEPGAVHSLVTAASKDVQWRVRAELAKHLGEISQVFSADECLKLLVTALLDLCDFVRNAVVTNLHSIIQHSSTVTLDHVIGCLFTLWKLNHAPPDGGTAIAIPTTDILYEVVMRSKRNITSYIVTKTLIRAFVTCLIIDDRPSDRILEDIILLSTADSIPNIRRLAWKSLEKLHQAKRVGGDVLAARLEQQLPREGDTDVLETMKVLKATI
ncbi:putative phosphatase [Gregarina niphandrodes]|uniref:Phosphatase n=1 Tax=Gregarina niphandrodes TaxID=110365 RepID=A0A023BCJ9_GRENI|nr:putative phosphatase [Gregarina niphandrodes]EZG83924.1 putative phosphatase [Gregarina niphandrodes]|eukprot:XP_011128888.1 putative phosphatase [Gregarina niphandrodes]